MTYTERTSPSESKSYNSILQNKFVFQTVSFFLYSFVKHLPVWY